jgi:hypothetical protein
MKNLIQTNPELHEKNPYVDMHSFIQNYKQFEVRNKMINIMFIGDRWEHVCRTLARPPAGRGLYLTQPISKNNLID